MKIQTNKIALQQYTVYSMGKSIRYTQFVSVFVKHVKK